LRGRLRRLYASMNPDKIASVPAGAHHQRKERGAVGVPRWITTATGIFVPAPAVITSPPAPRSYADLVLRFWKVCLSSQDVLNEPPDRKIAETALSSFPLRHCLAILSRAVFTLATPSQAEMLPTQKELAPIFFSLETLHRVDDWIRRHAENPDVYLFGEQQLPAAMTSAILNTKRSSGTPVMGPPFTGLGRALAHLAGLG